MVKENKNPDKKAESQKAQKTSEGTEKQASVPSDDSVTSVIKKTSGLPKKLVNIITEVEKLSVLELADLIKALEEKFGVTAATPTAVAPTTATTEDEETKKEEKDTYDVVLQEAGKEKIAVIKVLREIRADLGLKEAKTLVEEAPKPVLESAKKEEAEAAKKKLEGAGATVELK